MVVPNTIIIASFDIVSPNPFLIRDKISATGNCTPSPVTKQAMINAKKGCTLNFTVSRIIDAIPASKKIINWEKDEFIKLF
jgi:hypothetical protein